MSQAPRFDQAALEARLLAPRLQDLDHATVLSAAVPARPGLDLEAVPLVDVVGLIRGHGYTVPVRTPEGALELHQFSSTFEDDDFDSLPPMDAVALLDRLAEMERWLLHQGPDAATQHADGTRGFASLSKHKGCWHEESRHQGSSDGDDGESERESSDSGDLGANSPQVLRYDHHEPERSRARREEDRERGGSFPEYLETRCGPEHTLGEFRGGVVAVLPPPQDRFDLAFHFRPDARGRLHELPGNPRWGLAQAVREVSGAVRLELALRGAEERYEWELIASPDSSTWLRLQVPGLCAPFEATLDSLRSHLGIE